MSQSPEAIAIDRLRSVRSNVTKADAEALTTVFKALRSLDASVSSASPYELHEGRWAFLGLLSRGYQLLLCGIDELTSGNRNGFFASARGMVETVCAVAWVLENPSRLVSLVQFDGPSIGRIANAGYRRFPDLKRTYANLSSLAHPRRDSHLLGFREPREVAEKGPMSPFDMTMTDYSYRERLDLLVSTANRLVVTLNELKQADQDILSTGQVMVRLELREDETRG